MKKDYYDETERKDKESSDRWKQADRETSPEQQKENTIKQVVKLNIKDDREEI